MMFAPRSIVLQFALLGAVLLAAIWSVVLFDLHQHEKQAALDDRNELERVAQIGAQALQSRAESTDTLLLGLREHWRADPHRFPEVIARLQGRRDLDHGFHVTVIGADGRVRFSTAAPGAAGVDVSDREHFRLLEASGRDELIVARPMRPRLGGRRSGCSASSARCCPAPRAPSAARSRSRSPRATCRASSSPSTSPTAPRSRSSAATAPC